MRVWVVPESSDPINFGTPPTTHSEIYGGVLFTVVTVVEQRDGPRRLHDPDDAEFMCCDDLQTTEFLQSALRGYQTQRQTMSQLRQRDSVSGRNSVSRDKDDDDVGDETTEFLQSNLRAHDYRKQQLSRLP